MGTEEDVTTQISLLLTFKDKEEKVLRIKIMDIKNIKNISKTEKTFGKKNEQIIGIEQNIV